MDRKTKIVLWTALAVGALMFLVPYVRRDRVVEALVARNVAARGGAEAWRAVDSLRLTGEIDVGQDLLVPYALEQKRPDKMCLSYEFDGATAVQCTDGDSGWKVEPFRGRSTPEPMTDTELREVADLGDPWGLLFDYDRRGHGVKLLGRTPVDGRDAFELEVTLPGGGVRWVYLDAETALEVKVAAVRTRGQHERRVETVYLDWRPADGLLIPRRLETRTEGSKDAHALTVATVHVNPPLEDSSFVMPESVAARRKPLGVHPR